MSAPLQDQLSIRLSTEERLALKHLAAEQSRSIAYVARAAIQAYLREECGPFAPPFSHA